MVGRTGYYGREHVARLLLVREMLAEGYSLAMIERTLASAPPTASSATLALHRALLAPWLPPEPEVTTGAELAARAGVPEDPALVDQLVELGLRRAGRRRRTAGARSGAADRRAAGRGARRAARRPDRRPDAGQRARAGDRRGPTCRCSSTPAGRRSSTPGRRRSSCERVQDTVARLQPVGGPGAAGGVPDRDGRGGARTAVETALSRLAVGGVGISSRSNASRAGPPRPPRGR